jgi:nicotinamidase-related amidase
MVLSRDLSRYALVVVDVQEGFNDPSWKTRNNPACDDNIAALVERWHAATRPVVHIRHDDDDYPSSPLHPDSPGNRLKHYLSTPPDLLVTKHVNGGRSASWPSRLASRPRRTPNAALGL